MRNLLRLMVIVFVFGRYGVLPSRRFANPQRLARALEALGPSFIKLGQVLSTRADLVGEEMAAALASLRDSLPPFSSRTARRIIAEELGASVDALFTQFDDTPVAAASIAQVHKAVRQDGRKVAVKIIRPGVQRAFHKDLRLFFWIARILERRAPSMRRLKPVEVVKTLEQSVMFELDLRYEAAAMEELARNTKQDAGLRVPAVDWNATGERVLVSQWVEGIPIHQVDALIAAGHDLNHILARFSEHFFMQVFRDGFFHADLHPGNLFIDAEGNIVVVDFGIMGRLDWQSRIYVAEIFRGFLNEDYRHVAEVHFRAGYVPPHHSREQFAQAAMAIAKPILNKPVHEISLAKLLGQLFRVTEMFEMETQPQLLLLQKTLVVVEGVGRMLNPQVNMWEMARPPIEAWAAQHMGMRGRFRHAAQHAQDMAEKLPPLLSKLERALDKWLADDAQPKKETA